VKKSDYLKLLNVSSPYYLELDASFYILSIGDNFLKSVSNIKVKTSVFDYFLLDRKVEIIVDQLPDHWFDKMHFLELKGNLQRYKFSIVKQDSSYFLFAAPIINSAYALKNYNVTLRDFPVHDTIAEYLFIEQLNKKSLEESKEITSNLLVKNKEIKRFQTELNAISKFPLENPDPILRFDLKMKLVFNNAASEVSFLKDIEYKNDQIGSVQLNKAIQDAIAKKRQNTQIFLQASKNYYSIQIVLIFDLGYLNIYAHDITNYRKTNQTNEKTLKTLNEKVESQREFYEFILNNLPADVAVFDINHKYIFINPMGIKNDEVREYMIGKDDYDYCRLKGLSNDLADERRAVFNRILKTKKDEVWTDDLIDSKGNRNVIQRSMGPLFDANGNVRRVIGYGTDITKRVIAEEENIKLSLVALKTDNGVLMLDEKRRITWANQAMIDRSGFSLNEMIGNRPEVFLYDHKAYEKAERIQQALIEEKSIQLEMMRRSKQGREYWVSLSLQPLFGDDNEVTGSMMVEFDITDRIHNEQTIQNLNVNLERLVQEKTAKNMELASSLRDQEKMVTIGELASGVAHDLNTPLGAIQSGAENMTYTLGMLFKGVLPESNSEEVKYAFNRSMNSSFELFVGGVQMQHEKDAFVFYLKAIKSDFIQKNLQEVSFMMVKNRIDIKNIEEITHILNSEQPLLFLNLIYQVQMVFSFLETITNSGNRASEVVQNLRLFIGEKRNTESGVVNIKSNIGTVLNVFSHKIQNHVDLIFDVDPQIEVKGFDVRLFQLWSNLIKNAIECMEEQKDKMIKVYSETTPKEYFIIIENNGPMISPDLKTKIFNKFFTTKGKLKGSGLGLSIVKNVLEEHQGKITLTSDSESTKFIIKFKREQ
tara:strand:+ start:2830 stop:5460 length:2631 start_codon:yes stop_codon:yes gene_type:complete